MEGPFIALQRSSIRSVHCGQELDRRKGEGGERESPPSRSAQGRTGVEITNNNAANTKHMREPPARSSQGMLDRHGIHAEWRKHSR